MGEGVIVVSGEAPQDRGKEADHQWRGEKGGDGGGLVQSVSSWSAVQPSEPNVDGGVVRAYEWLGSAI